MDTKQTLRVSNMPKGMQTRRAWLFPQQAGRRDAIWSQIMVAGGG